MIWGYPHSRKPPYGNRIGPNVSEAIGSNIPKFRICMGAMKTISIWVVYDIALPALLYTPKSCLLNGENTNSKPLGFEVPCFQTNPNLRHLY